MTVWDNPAFVEKWNETYGLDMARAPIRPGFIFKWLERESGGFAGKRILDLGCGNGNLILHFRQAAFQEWVGVDGGSAILRTAQESVRDSRVKFVHADVTKPFPYEETGRGFDVVTSVFVPEEIPADQFVSYGAVMAGLLSERGTALVFTNHPANAMLEDLTALAQGKDNQKFEGLEGYFDRRESTYKLEIMNTAQGFAAKAAYHHKTIADLMNGFARAGLAVSAMIEVPRGISTLEEFEAHTPRRGDVPRFLGFVLKPF